MPDAAAPTATPMTEPAMPMRDDRAKAVTAAKDEAMTWARDKSFKSEGDSSELSVAGFFSATEPVKWRAALEVSHEV